MDLDIFALASFVLITTFTPGPNNLSSASMGILVGYRQTLPYLAGITAGFFMVLLLCGWLSAILLEGFPAFETVLRIVGSLYILWLAFHTLRASYAFDEEGQHVLGFWRGFFLQILNPKALAFGLTLYGTFLAGLLSPVALLASAAVSTFIVFCAISTWTLFGAFIRNTIDHPSVKRGLNFVLSLLLVYTALELSGLVDLLRS
ncbi:MAG: LysE family transporter [Anaerolineales bacterium]|nr:LysE family transporter [Anaerolineales bacterium]